MRKVFAFYRTDIPEVIVTFSNSTKYGEKRYPYIFFYSEAAVVGAILKMGIYGNICMVHKTQLDFHGTNEDESSDEAIPIDESFYLFLKNMLNGKCFVVINNERFGDSCVSYVSVERMDYLDY